MFEKGNKLGQRAGLFGAALKRAIAQDDGKRLRECAEQLLTLAAAGEPWAVKELADRLDGKAAQPVHIEPPPARVEEYSLEQLTASLAAAAGVAGGVAAAPSGPGEPGQVH